MSFFEKLFNFFKSISYYFKKTLVKNESVLMLEEKDSNTNLEPNQQNSISEDMLTTINSQEENKINASKRTLTTRLYILEQEIELFKADFPSEYDSFMDKIKSLKNSYNSQLEKITKNMTFEIDPETDGSKIGDVVRLEKEIKRFINRDVKLYILLKKLQKLIVKLNILYNTSMSHFREEEKVKVISQLIHAISVETDLVEELKECDFILYDKQLMERFVTLISYIDYEIFKTNLRNSENTPNNLIDKLVLSVKFKDFDIIDAFNAFIRDELSDLNNITYLISEEEYRKDCEKKISSLLYEIAFSDENQNVIMDSDFWKKVFILESSTLELLKASGVEKEKAKVKILDRVEVEVSENEVLTLPKTNAYLSLTSVFSSTQDTKVFLLIKLFKNLSNEITYKEIYFLLVLFDVLDVIENTQNGLVRYMKKYISKYPYDNKTLDKRKDEVINSLSEKEYVFGFSLNDGEEILIQTLKDINIDFKVYNNKIYISSFYFKNLGNVMNILKENTIKQ